MIIYTSIISQQKSERQNVCGYNRMIVCVSTLKIDYEKLIIIEYILRWKL